jgi:hypothetical protein
MSKLTLIVVSLILSVACFGAEVLQVGSTQRVIAISHETFRKWTIGDNVCVIQVAKEVACGVVIRVSTKGAVLKLDNRNTDIVRGDMVRLVPPTTRKPAAVLLNSVEKDDNARAYGFNVSAGISAGLNFFFPLIQLQRSIGPYFAIGLMPTYFKAAGADSSVSAFGGLLTANYYNHEYFRGLWAQLGGGILSLTVDNQGVTQKASTPIFLSTVGWRGYWDLGLNVGIAAGLQYIQNPNFASVEIHSFGVQPLVLLDIGFNF